MAALGNIFNIPHFITSESVEGLRGKMLENNAKYSREFDYYSIIFDGKNYIAFFYMMAEESQFLRKKQITKKV